MNSSDKIRSVKLLLENELENCTEQIKYAKTQEHTDAEWLQRVHAAARIKRKQLRVVRAELRDALRAERKAERTPDFWVVNGEVRWEKPLPAFPFGPAPRPAKFLD